MFNNRPIVQQRAAGVDGTFNTSQLDKENQLVKKTIWAAVASLLVVASLGVPAMAAQTIRRTMRSPLSIRKARTSRLPADSMLLESDLSTRLPTVY